MAQAAEPLDRDGVAWCDGHFADSVEDGYAGAEERRVGGGIGGGGDADGGFGAEGAVFCVYTALSISLAFFPYSYPSPWVGI